MSAKPAAMSVVLVTDEFKSIRRPLNHLAAQTIRDQLEIVVVMSSAEVFPIDPSQFASVKIIRMDPIKTMPAGRARGAREATTPIVAFVETHSFPAPEWAEALLERHREDWAVVGPMVLNANPRSSASRASFALDYARWCTPSAGGEIDDLPGHNSSYKRAILLNLDDKLDEILEAEFVLHGYLRSQGYRLYLEPLARTWHLNTSLPRSWIAERVQAGRLMAAIRSRKWKPVRRLVYCAGAPFIPFVRLARVLRDAVRLGQKSSLSLSVFPVLLVALAISAFGEMIGFAFGTGNAFDNLLDMELHREAHVVGWQKGNEILALGD